MYTGEQIDAVLLRASRAMLIISDRIQDNFLYLERDIYDELRFKQRDIYVLWKCLTDAKNYRDDYDTYDALINVLADKCADVDSYNPNYTTLNPNYQNISGNTPNPHPSDFVTLEEVQELLDGYVNKIGDETISDTKTFTGNIDVKNAEFPAVRGLDIFHYGEIPILPTSGIDIPNEIYRWGYEIVISTNEQRYLPASMNSTPFDPTFPCNIMEFGFEGISTHTLHGTDVIEEGGKDFMIWNNRWKDVRTAAPQDNLAGTWFQLHTGIYSEMQEGGNSTTWHSRNPNSTPFQYYRKQSTTFNDPAFIYQSSGDNAGSMIMLFRKNRNLLGNPFPTLDGDVSMNLSAQVVIGNGLWGDIGSVKFKSGGDASLTSSGGIYSVSVTPENSLTPIERFIIDKLGRTKIIGVLSVGGDSYSDYGGLFYSPTSSNYAAAFRDGGGNKSIIIQVNVGGKNLIGSNYFSGGGYLPLALSGRFNNTDLVLNPDGTVQVGSLATEGIVTNTSSGVLGTTTTPSLGMTSFSDGVQGFKIGAYTSGAGYGAIYPYDATPNGSNYFLVANSTATIFNNPVSASIAVNGSEKITVTSGGVSVPAAPTSNDHVVNKGYADATYKRAEFGLACSDETTDLTSGTAKVTLRIPYAMTITSISASVNTAPVGSTLVVDINENGTSILSTKLSIDAGEKTSTTAATPYVLSDTAIAADSEITIDIDQVGASTAGKGLKVIIIGTRN